MSAVRHRARRVAGCRQRPARRSSRSSYRAFTNAPYGVTLSVNDEAFSRLVHAPFDRTHVPGELRTRKGPQLQLGAFPLLRRRWDSNPRNTTKRS